MPFSNYNDNLNSRELISSVTIDFNESEVKALPVVDGATNAVIQFYLDAANIAILGAANLGSTPIAKVSEGKFRTTSPAEMPAGMQLAYMGIYEITSIKNLQYLQFVGLQASLTVLADVSYYK